MKTLKVASMAAMTLIVLSACHTTNTTKSSTSTSSTTQTTVSTTQTTSSEVDTATSMSSYTMDSEKIDDTRKETPTEDVSFLRRTLYQAGINSSELTDEQLLTYDQEAKAANQDFADYVKAKIEP